MLLENQCAFDLQLITDVFGLFDHLFWHFNDEFYRIFALLVCFLLIDVTDFLVYFYHF